MSELVRDFILDSLNYEQQTADDLYEKALETFPKLDKHVLNELLKTMRGQNYLPTTFRWQQTSMRQFFYWKEPKSD